MCLHLIYKFIIVNSSTEVTTSNHYISPAILHHFLFMNVKIMHSNFVLMIIRSTKKQYPELCKSLDFYKIEML